MNDTMRTIGDYVLANLAAFGLTAKEEYKTISKSKEPMAGGKRWLVMLPLRTVPDTSREVPFNNLIGNGEQGTRHLTSMEIECRSRAENLDADFYWNEARAFRDQVYKTLSGANGGGLVIPRYYYPVPTEEVPAPARVLAGEIWFEVNPKNNTPMEDEIEDLNDPSNKSVFMTFKVHWQNPL